jgi:hypothetical protein
MKRVTRAEKRYSELQQYFLPDEVWMMVLQNLDLRAKIVVRLVSRRWRTWAYQLVTSLERTRGLTDRDLRLFVGSLTSLNIDGSAIPRMKPTNRVTDAGLKRCTNLTALVLAHNTRITDLGISDLRNLASLDLNANRKITNNGISQLSNLTSLCLACTNVSSAGFSALTNLTSLSLACTNFTSYGFSALTNLTVLDVSNCSHLRDEDFSLLTKLHTLDISDADDITH